LVTLKSGFWFFGGLDKKPVFPVFGGFSSNDLTTFGVRTA